MPQLKKKLSVVRFNFIKKYVDYLTREYDIQAKEWYWCVKVSYLDKAGHVISSYYSHGNTPVQAVNAAIKTHHELSR